MDGRAQDLPVLWRKSAYSTAAGGNHIVAQPQGHYGTVSLHIEVFVLRQAHIAEHTGPR